MEDDKLNNKYTGKSFWEPTFRKGFRQPVTSKHRKNHPKHKKN